MGKKENKYLENFFKAVLSLKTEEECEAFFEDVCTIKELQDMTYRLEVARRLSNGEVFSDISRETGSSSATIGRVNKCLNYGPGGYNIVLDRLGLIEKK
ncbi:MAG: DNA-binding transcriptional regulator [Clostridiales bacterium]|nr:DNA-binding transcriptional regulator [Clostridiales bacterium]